MLAEDVRRWARKSAIVLAIVGLIAGLLPTLAAAQVSPPAVDAVLYPGDSMQVEKTVEVPAVTPRLDIALDVDLSGSYYDDLPNIKSLAPGIFDNVRASVPDSDFGLATFVDFPFYNWGDAGFGDYAYQRDQDMTGDRATWLNAVNAMSTRSGYDGPESQYESLYQAATGAGREMPPTTDGDYDDLGEIPPGLGLSFRADATKIIAITTDAPFHNAGDGGGPFPYPGASRDDTVSALVASGIRVIVIKAPGSGSEMDDIAAATGGVVVTTGSSSAEIAEAILSGITELTFDVTGNPVGCGPLNISFDPPIWEDVPGGSTVEFLETISVPADVTADDLPPGGVVECTVDFKAGDAVIGQQVIRITVPVGICPTVLDNFDRWPAPYGYAKLGPNWRGATTLGNYRIIANQVQVLAGGAIYWQPDSYGPDQEACVTLTNIDAKGHHGVLLKIQGDPAYWKQGVIGVSYSNYEKPRNKVKVETYVPGQGWTTLALFDVLLQNGDQLGGRALPNGTVEVYVNKVKVGEVDAGPFFVDKGGSIGLWFMSPGYPHAALDDFSGR